VGDLVMAAGCERCGHGWFKGTGMVALGEGQLERGKGGVGGGLVVEEKRSCRRLQSQKSAISHKSQSRFQNSNKNNKIKSNKIKLNQINKIIIKINKLTK
jgi:hypothetical protein